MSNEHLFPKWLRKLLPPEALNERMNYTFRRSGEVIRNSQIRIFELTVKDVCKRCNETWMEDLELGVQRFAKGMLKGNGRHLHERDQTALAAWATLKVLVGQRAFPLDSALVRPEDYRTAHEWGKRKLPPPEVTVFTGSVPWSAGQMDPGFFHLNGIVFGKPTVGQKPDGCLGTFSVMDLVVRVGWPYRQRPGLFRPNRILADSLQQIWPFLGSIVWPPPVALTRDDLLTIATGKRGQRF